ncbi:MAG: ATP-dependent 6-phosphofructokinase [Nitrospirae bacterium]|nr:ATP-dependent 6-phosphofructokinase [Nitrospirota bacterium]
MKKVGVLTGGGDCPGLNAVIRAIVKSAEKRYGWEVIGIEDSFEGLIRSGKTRVMTSYNIRGILPLGGTILHSSNKANPFEYVDPDDPAAGPRDMSRTVLQNFGTWGLDALIAIGGDGTNRLAARLFDMGLPVVGVPKTIDNDLRATDVTFGFNTAVTTATECLDKLHTTAASHHRVIVVEVMGRYTGWIALESGLAGGADVILMPEIPYDMDAVVHKILERAKLGSGFSIVVVAEGAKPKGGGVVVREKGGKGKGLDRLGGVSIRVGDEIAERTGVDVRVTVLGHIQRGGSPTPFDRNLSTRFGAKAMSLVAKGQFGHMVCLKGQDVTSVPIHDAITDYKWVPLESGAVLTAEAIGICLGRFTQFP